MLHVIISAALAGLLSVASAQKDIITCDEPPDVKYAFVSNVTDEDFALGTIVTYACEGGYSSSGESRTIFCDKDDSGRVVWSKNRFFCAPKSCGDPGYLNNGRRVGHRFTFPNSIKYECDDGYKIKGIPTRYCQTSGLWSGRLPSCNIVTCDPPEEIANGRISYNSLEYGSELRYECNRGFKLQMNGTAYCTADGQWSKNSVMCVESTCEFPIAPEHGTVRFADNDQVPRSGTIALYECDGDRVAYGATTVKCLDDGQWLFPAPECLSPCTVPNIHEGKLGSYEKKTYYGSLSFNEKSAGTRIKDDEELSLRCSRGYEVESTENREMKISCKRGKWSLKPLCEPASCRINPPSVQNAEIVDVNPKHGGKVIYRCIKNFKKIKDDNVVCDFGSWKPHYLYNLCQSSQCSKDKLNFDGLRKGYEAWYDDGHLFQIACEQRYRINEEAELRCSEGDWKTNVRPCVPADCEEPPATPFAKVEKVSTSHGSYATYACQEPYKLIGNSKVQCWFGKWENLPKCDDGRCDINDLHHSSHISREETPRYTNSGRKLDVTCKEGYSPRYVTPFCLNGEWTRNTMPPCMEKDCSVPEVEHGFIVEKVLAGYSWDFWQARYVQEVKEKIVPHATLVGPSTVYHLRCKSGYSFQGAPETERRITCTKGNWIPAPVCIRSGNQWAPTQPTISNKWFNKETTSIMQETTPMSVTTESQKTSVSDVIHPEVVITESPTTAEPVKCSCQYPLDDKSLIATADGRQLHYLDKVEDGSLVVFRCLHVGYHRISGPRQMKCENCQNWDSSNFPTCSSPSHGDTMIIFQRDMSISVDGSLEVQKGRNLDLSCIVNEGGVYPNWTVPTLNGVTYSWEKKDRKDRNDILYISLLKIENAALENEGAYNCSSEDHVNTPSTVTVTVIDPNVQCPEFEEDDEIHVSYDNERRVKSTATFSCKYQGRELKGKATLACLTNGNWSDPPPQCLKRKCKILKESEQLKIDYENGQEIGSLARFHCVDGTKHVGVGFAECLDNGSWMHPTPACNYPPCSLEAIYPLLPKEAMLVGHNGQDNTFEYNTSISLRCEDGLITLGDSLATCGKNSTWEIQPSFLCSPGCPAQDKPRNSKLRVDPMKDIYKFSEEVRFSCPTGMHLTTNVQTNMCMTRGWSEKKLPDCA